MKIRMINYLSILSLFIPTTFAAESLQPPTDSNPQFSTIKVLPEILKPFVINETPGVHGNVTLALTREQYHLYRELITSLTHVSIIVRD